MPVLVSPSRKSFLRALTGRDIAQSGPATLAAEIFAAWQGADYIRTHDVAAARDALTLLAAVVGSQPCVAQLRNRRAAVTTTGLGARWHDASVATRLTARAMAAGVRAGELSAAELVADALSAAAALDPALHFVDSLTPDSALEAAARIDGLPLGQRDGLSLAGVPFLAKAATVASRWSAGGRGRGPARHVNPAGPGGGEPGLGLEWT